MSFVLAFIIVFATIVFVHEFGHFISARKSGMNVEEFGFGFPPRLVAIKRGKTVYSLNLIPLGGFVKIKGEDGEDRESSDSFASKSIFRRAVTLAAGVFANVVLAFLIFTFCYIVGAPQMTDNLPPDAIVTTPQTIIAGVLPGSPADKATLKADDIILKINGEKITGVKGLQAMIKNSSGDVDLDISRSGKEIGVRVAPVVLSETGSRGIGVSLAEIGIVRFPWWSAPVYAARAVASVITAVGSSLWNLVFGIFVGKGVTSEVTGPIGVAAATGEAAGLGWRYLAQFTAILSLNLAVLNIIPFPALDGGRLFFLVLEALRRRPVSRKVEGIVHQSGFALLMLLVLVITWKDLVRYGGAIGGFFQRMF
jgi:regulator of sigma E protease